MIPAQASAQLLIVCGFIYSATVLYKTFLPGATRLPGGTVFKGLEFFSFHTTTLGFVVHPENQWCSSFIAMKRQLWCLVYLKLKVLVNPWFPVLFWKYFLCNSSLTSCFISWLYNSLSHPNCFHLCFLSPVWVHTEPRLTWFDCSCTVCWMLWLILRFLFCELLSVSLIKAILGFFTPDSRLHLGLFCKIILIILLVVFFLNQRRLTLVDLGAFMAKSVCRGKSWKAGGGVMESEESDGFTLQKLWTLTDVSTRNH